MENVYINFLIILPSTKGCCESTIFLNFPSFTNSPNNFKSSEFGDAMKGTSFCFENVTFLKIVCTIDLKFGVRSITLPLGERLELNLDHGMSVAQWIIASYLRPDGLFKASPSGVL